MCPASKLCEELGLQPTLFYRWQKDFFEDGAAAFQAKAGFDRLAESAHYRVPGEVDDQGRDAGRVDDGLT